MSDVAGGELSLREAREADLDAIWRIEREVFGAEAWSRDTLRSELLGEYRHYLVLVDGDTVSSTASDTDTDTNSDTESVVRGYAGLLAVGEDGDIQTIALEPSVRGGGHGRSLMNALLDEAERRGVKQVFLEVRADNPPARGALRLARLRGNRGAPQVLPA